MIGKVVFIGIKLKRWFDQYINKVLNGRPMICIEYYFTDVVTGEPVYKYMDRLGNIWMATNKWGWFRVKCKQ